MVCVDVKVHKNSSGKDCRDFDFTFFHFEIYLPPTGKYNFVRLVFIVLLT